MGYYDVQQVCLNGHQITDSYNDFPQHRKQFCPTCGEKTIYQCPNCNMNIKGTYQVDGVISIGHKTPVPSHCEGCGKPYPWTIRNQQIESTQEVAKTPEILAKKQEGGFMTIDSKKVFVVHGRNENARAAMFTFLRSIGLEPIEWIEAIKLTGKAAPYIGEVLDVAFSHAQAIVILLTGDDLARLGNKFTNPGEVDEELTPQARPNVLFEAGLAFGRNPDRTILVQLGSTRPISDLAGRHSIIIDNSSKKRQELASRLITAGCGVQIEHRTDWHTTGNFDKGIVTPDKSEMAQHVAPKHGQPQKSKAQKLIIKQVKELRIKLANGIQTNDPILERDYRIEYVKLLRSAIIEWMGDTIVFNQLVLLQAEAQGFNIKIIKSDNLATIKWVLNSVDKMLTILQI